MKIAFICIYSHPSICGVWSRVQNIGKMLVERGHEVHIFSTNVIKGGLQKSSSNEACCGMKIHRFSPHASFGENMKFWNFSKELEKLNPDLIVAEVYRHPHTKLALKVAKKLHKPIFLTTHAPFVEPELRSKAGGFLESFYDKFIGPSKINSFDKIITITRWEEPFLKKIGLSEKKKVYLPNGIPPEFFKIKSSSGKGILFLGRISPIKNLEALLRALSLLVNKYPSLNLRFVGPAEDKYKKSLEKLAKLLKIEKNVSFLPPIYDLKEKIKMIDSCEIFVLPSKREAMPQSLIEAMAREKIVIASSNKGAEEIIEDGQNGFLFPISNAKALAAKIDFCIQEKNSNMLRSVRKQAREKAEEFSWEKIFKNFEKILPKEK